jgi:hypothetical protein
MGDKYLESNLTEEKASALNGLGQYFGLEQLEQAIEMEQTDRVMTAMLDHSRAEQAIDMENTKRYMTAIMDYLSEQQLRDRRLLKNCPSSTASNGRVKCVTCGDWTTKAPTYRGNTPRCWDCRQGAG